MNTSINKEQNSLSLGQFVKIVKNIKKEKHVYDAVHFVEQKYIQIDQSFNIEKCLRTVQECNTTIIHRETIDFLLDQQNKDDLYDYLLYNLIYLEIKNKFNDQIKQNIFDKITYCTLNYYKRQCYESSL